MFEARLIEGALLKKIVEAVRELVTDANLDCSESGISMQAMDSSHVSLCAMLIRSDGFDHYRCDRSLSIGLSMANMSKILKCAGNTDKVTLKAEDKPDILTLMFESESESRRMTFLCSPCPGGSPRFVACDVVVVHVFSLFCCTTYFDGATFENTWVLEDFWRHLTMDDGVVGRLEPGLLSAFSSTLWYEPYIDVFGFASGCCFVSLEMSPAVAATTSPRPVARGLAVSSGCNVTFFQDSLPRPFTSISSAVLRCAYRLTWSTRACRGPLRGCTWCIHHDLYVSCRRLHRVLTSCKYRYGMSAEGVLTKCRYRFLFFVFLFCLVLFCFVLFCFPSHLQQYCICRTVLSLLLLIIVVTQIRGRIAGSFPPPTHYGSCIAFLSREDFSSFFPRRLASNRARL